MRKIIFILIASLLTISAQAQLKKKKLPRNITSGLENEKAPYISADGLSIAFMAQDAFTKQWSLNYAQKIGGVWKRSVRVEVVNKSHKLNQMGGYCLSGDGQTLYFTTKKYGGVGQSDIWLTNRDVNGNWSTPKSMGAPINSTEHDANPSISSDGKYMYFMRCSSLNNTSSECCKLMVAENKAGSVWNAPKELPASINAGCESTPRILPDGETLIFASKRPGGHGGLDLYLTRHENGTWAPPKAMVMFNTPNDDQFVSVANLPQLMYIDRKGEESDDLFMVQVPDEFQQKTMLTMRGYIKASGSGQPLLASIIATDQLTGEVIAKSRSSKDGSYIIFLKEGVKYDFAVLPLKKEYAFYSERIDLSAMEKGRTKRVNIDVRKVEDGAVLLPEVTFKEHSAEIDDMSFGEIKRCARALEGNPGLNCRVVSFNKTLAHSPERSDEMTELEVDSITANHSVVVDGLELVEQTDMGMNVSFNNNRTQEEADEVVKKLVALGVDAKRMTPEGAGSELGSLVDVVGDKERGVAIIFAPAN